MFKEEWILFITPSPPPWFLRSAAMMLWIFIFLFRVAWVSSEGKSGERAPNSPRANPRHQIYDLIVLSVGLSLGIKNTRPVLRLKVGLVVDIDLNLECLPLGLDGVGGNALGIE